ncbi:MAG: hypothetical protein CME70_02420 [Halobacteriovorax sp.]|nr:hypothetical protein [Halobacteriovorax sp.]|tara:strand:- start:30865 stop:32232 length:1368 start_codon:yes stop_codon:yes gene_type:complete
MSAAMKYDEGSFKDPSGRVFYLDGEVYRSADSETIKTLKEFFVSNSFEKIKSYLIETKFVSNPEGDGEVLWHKKVSHFSYCYEWTPEQLKDAALATIEIQLALLEDGYTLKDATPFNICFISGQPKFIDLPSICKMEEGSAWSAFTEYLENFVYPLMAFEYLKIPVNKFTMSEMGKINMEEASALFQKFSFLKPGVLKYIRIPNYFRNKAQKDETVNTVDKQTKVPKSVIVNNCRGLKDFVSGLKLNFNSTHWVSYKETRTYSSDDKNQKAEFIRGYLKDANFKTGLDIGANTGEYSKLLSEFCKDVVAVEYDQQCCDRIYQMTKEEKLPILPIQMNFSSPTPAMGWANVERKSFMERFESSDIVLALAVIHHLRITNNVPLDLVIKSFARLGKRMVIEWVPETDVMVKKLLERRENTYTDYTEEGFQNALKTYFKIEEVVELSQGRKLFGCTVK